MQKTFEWRDARRERNSCEPQRWVRSESLQKQISDASINTTVLLTNNFLIISYRNMYWTGSNGIMRASMDGTNSVQIVSGLVTPRGIVVDFQTSALFWVDAGTKRVQTSRLDGSSVATLAGTIDSSPWGIAVDRDRVYFGSFGSSPYALRSCSKTGGDIKTHYTGGTQMQHLAFISSRHPTTTRRNDCAGQSCSGNGICVLTPSSYRCLNL